MTDDADLLDDFPSRYAIEAFSDGDGVLIDLRTGGYFKLNTSATKVCEALRTAETVDEAITHIASSLRLRREEAAGMLASVKDGLLKQPTPQESAGPLRYVSSSDGSAIFEEDGRAIFSIGPGSQSVRLQIPLSKLTGPLVLYLQALVPKLLSLVEIPVLHAAACQIAGSLLAFSGRSGAGKTTTARAFEGAGAHLLSEDLVVLSLTDGSPLMYVDGERIARQWAREAARQLEGAPQQDLDFSALSDSRQGDTIPLADVWFVDVKRRTGSDLRLRTLSMSDGALALLSNGLLATSFARHWRDLLRRSRLIAERTILTEATMPDGLRNLRAAAERYIVNSAS